MPDTLMPGVVSKLSNFFGFLVKTNSYGLKFTKFGVLNILYANVANDKYFGYTWPKFDRHFIKIIDSDLIPCSVCKEWWLYDVTVFILIPA